MRFAAATLAVLALLGLAATPALGARTGPAVARAEHQRIVRYWTPARQAGALERDAVRSSQAGKKPPSSGGGSAVTGAEWTKAGAVAVVVGKTFFTMGAYNYTCSGSVVTDTRSAYSLVLTAGHCAYDQDANAFATNWLFIPAWGSAPNRSCGSTAYGCWTAQALLVDSGFATAGAFNSQATVHDFAFAVVGAGGKSRGQLDATVGHFDLVSPIDSVASGTRMYAFGYPASGKFRGDKLTYCSGDVFSDIYNSNLTWGMKCNMTSGSSGGPWLLNFSESTGTGQIGSLNSYGYSGLKNMYGPRFNADTQAVYAEANQATANTIVN